MKKIISIAILGSLFFTISANAEVRYEAKIMELDQDCVLLKASNTQRKFCFKNFQFSCNSLHIFDEVYLHYIPGNSYIQSRFLEDRGSTSKCFVE